MEWYSAVALVAGAVVGAAMVSVSACIGVVLDSSGPGQAVYCGLPCFRQAGASGAFLVFSLICQRCDFGAGRGTRCSSMLWTAVRADLAGAVVLVLTSNWEANSLVLIEACAAGLPWISFDVGSAKHVPGGVIAKGVADVARLVRESPPTSNAGSGCPRPGSLSLGRWIGRRF